MSTLLAGYTLGTFEPIFLFFGDGVELSNWWKGTWENLVGGLEHVFFSIAVDGRLEAHGNILKRHFPFFFEIGGTSHLKFIDQRAQTPDFLRTFYNPISLGVLWMQIEYHLGWQTKSKK